MKTTDKLLIAATILLLIFMVNNSNAHQDMPKSLFKEIQKYELDMQGLEHENKKKRSEKKVLEERVLKLSNEIEKNSAKFQNLEGRRDKALEYLNSIEEGLELEQ